MIDPFVLGVFDDDRTPREKEAPKAKALDEELYPRKMNVRELCPRCGMREPEENEPMCHACNLALLKARRRYAQSKKERRAGKHE